MSEQEYRDPPTLLRMNECEPFPPPENALVRVGCRFGGRYDQAIRISDEGWLEGRNRRMLRSRLAIILTDPDSPKAEASIRETKHTVPETGETELELTTVQIHPDYFKTLGRRIRDWENWYNLLPYSDRLRFPSPPGGKRG